MSPPSNSQGLSTLRAALRRHWHVALVAFCLPAALVGGLVAFLPGIYRGKATVLVEQSAVPGAASDDLEVRLQQLTQENLSRPRLQALMKQVGLGTQAGGAALSVEAVRRDIVVQTQKVEAAGKPTSVAVTVSVRGRDPVKVAQTANALASYYVVAEREQLRAASDTVAKHVDELRKRFKEEEQRVASYQDKHLRELPEAVGVHMASVEGLNAQLEMINLNRSRALERARALARRTDPSGAGGPAFDVGDADSEVGRLRATLRELKSRYTDEHPDVIRVRHELEAAEKRRAAAPRHAARAPRGATASELQDLDAQLRAADRAEAGLKDQIAGALKSAFNAPRRGQELNALLPRYDAARSAYQQALKQQEELRLLRVDRSPFRVLEEAVVPSHPVGPDRVRLAALGLIFALLVAAATTWLAQQTDNALHTVADIRALVRVPVLASIPRMSTVGEKRRARLRAVAIALLAVLAMAAIVAVVYRFAPDNDTLVRLLMRKGTP